MPRRIRKTHWSPQKRTRIRVMYELGVPKREIAAKEGVPAGSIHGIVTRFTEQKSGQSQPRPGRPKKPTDGDCAGVAVSSNSPTTRRTHSVAQEDQTSNDAPQPSAYSTDQISCWLHRINPPWSILQYAQTPEQIPKTPASLRTLMRCQITTFPYENLSVHYSPTHLVDIHPPSLYNKMMGPENGGRGGYCMELSIFFYHMLLGIGFEVHMTGVRNRTRTNGVPGGTYQGWTHIINIVRLQSGDRYAVDVAFGGDGPTSPLPMKESATPMKNLGTQEVRLVHEFMPKQHQRSVDSKVWIYQYRNGAEKEWNSFYSFAELEFFQEDFEVMNWWGSAKTLHRWTILVVRFLRRGDGVLFDQGARETASGDYGEDGREVEVVGKVMMVNDTVKVNLSGRTTIAETFDTEIGRLKALRDYFGIRLTKDQEESIRGWDMALG